MLAVYNTFGQVMWTMLVLFAWILFFWLLFAVFGDLFRRSDVSGWGKAAWSIFVIFLPFLGCWLRRDPSRCAVGRHEPAFGGSSLDGLG